MKKGLGLSIIYSSSIVLILLFSAISPGIVLFPPSSSNPIKHVIIVVDENHSFDNLFGTYPYGYPAIHNDITDKLPVPDTMNLNVTVPYVPWWPGLGGMHPYYANTNTSANPNEGAFNYWGDYWYGHMTGFVFFSGTQSMAYYSYQQTAPLWDYAEEYALADHFFSPVLGVTEPNRIADLIGMPPGFSSDYAIDTVPINESIFYQLSQYGISWNYYVYNMSKTLWSVPWPIIAFKNAGIYDSHYQELTNFYASLRTGNLPDVSWINFLGSVNLNQDTLSMHPPYNMSQGENAFVSVVNAVMTSKYCDSTAILFYMDEWGGYYDHVVPPKIGGTVIGGRIPLLIISPYAKESYIASGTMTPYTTLAFIEYLYHLPFLTWYVANSNLSALLQAFNFYSSPRAPIILDVSSNPKYPIYIQ